MGQGHKPQGLPADPYLDLVQGCLALVRFRESLFVWCWTRSVPSVSAMWLGAPDLQHKDLSLCQITKGPRNSRTKAADNLVAKANNRLAFNVQRHNTKLGESQVPLQ